MKPMIGKTNAGRAANIGAARAMNHDAIARPDNVIASKEGGRIQAVVIATALNARPWNAIRSARRRTNQPTNYRWKAPNAKARQVALRAMNPDRGVRAVVVVVAVADPKAARGAANDGPLHKVTANTVRPMRKVANDVRRSEATVNAVRDAISSAARRRRRGETIARGTAATSTNSTPTLMMTI
jgi:hypothetical protein